jgi:23S rRNA pseudouridine1911/1915/1917 synthase
VTVSDIVVSTTPEADPGVEVPVVFEDDQVVVVDKPADLVVHPGAGHDGGTLVAGLLARYPELAQVGDPPVRASCTG